MAALIKPYAESKPDDPALIDEFGTTSWKDFNGKVNQLIHALRRAGLQSGDAFSVLSGNRREYFEAFAAGSSPTFKRIHCNLPYRTFYKFLTI